MFKNYLFYAQVGHLFLTFIYFNYKIYGSSFIN